MWKKHRSEENLIGFDEISLDPIKISPDLREIVLESGFFRRILENFGQNLEILARIYKFWPESRNISVSLGFRGGKPKPDPPESVSGVEDQPPTCWSSRVGRFRVGSCRFFGLVKLSDEFGQPVRFRSHMYTQHYI